jgi:hypothetical protein
MWQVVTHPDMALFMEAIVQYHILVLLYPSGNCKFAELEWGAKSIGHITTVIAIATIFGPGELTMEIHILE